MTHLSGRSRGPAAPARRAACLLALSGALLLSCLGASAQAATPTTSFFFETNSGSNGFVDASAFSGSSTDTYRLDLVRGGTVIASDSEPGSSEGNFAFVSVPNNGPLQAGDVGNFYDDTTKTLLGSATYDGTPTINGDACVGSKSFTGTRNSAAHVLRAGAFRPSSGSGTPGPSGTPTDTDTNTYSVALSLPLQSGDRPYAEEHYTSSDGLVDITSELISNVAATCPTAGGTTTTTTTTNNTTTTHTTTVPVLAGPSLAQVFAALQSALANFGVQLNQYTPLTLSKKSVVFFTLSFLEAGSSTITIYVTPLGSSARAAASKRIKLASGGATLKAPGKVKIKLKLSSKGRQALKHSKKARLGLVTTFTPANGKGKQTATSSVTLRSKKTKKKK